MGRGEVERDRFSSKRRRQTTQTQFKLTHAANIRADKEKEIVKTVPLRLRYDGEEVVRAWRCSRPNLVCEYLLQTPFPLPFPGAAVHGDRHGGGLCRVRRE
jgi:hypothetical protein